MSMTLVERLCLNFCSIHDSLEADDLPRCFSTWSS